MQPLHAMYVHENDAENAIGFEINLKALAAASHVKFVQYVEIKFDAKRMAVGKTMREIDYPFGTIALRFPQRTYADAKAFCSDKLLDNGSPNHDFHHVLENADLSEGDVKDLMWQMSGRPGNPFRHSAV